MSGEIDTGVGPGDADEIDRDEGEDEELDIEALAAKALEAGVRAREQAGEVDSILTALDAHAGSLAKLEGAYPDLLGGGGYHTTARDEFEQAMREHEGHRDRLLDRLETIAPTEAMARRMLRIAEEDGAMALARYIDERLVTRGILQLVDPSALPGLERQHQRKYFVRIPVGQKPRPVYMVPEGDNAAMYLGAMARRGFRRFFDGIDAEEAEAERILKTPIDPDAVEFGRLFDPLDWQYRYPYVDALPLDRFQSGTFGFGVYVRGLPMHNPRKRRGQRRDDHEQKTSGVLLGAVVPVGFKGRDGKQVTSKALEVYRVVGDLRWVIPSFRRYVLPDARGNYPADRLPPPPAAQAHLVPKLQFASIAVLKLIERIQEQSNYENGRLLLRGRGEHGVLTQIEERQTQRGRRKAKVEERGVPEWWKDRRDTLKKHPLPKDPALPQVVGRGLSDQIEQAVGFAIYVDRLPLTRGKDEVTWSGVIHLSVAPTAKDGMAAKLFTIVDLHGAVEGDAPGTPVPVIVKGANLTVQLTAEAPPLTDGRNVRTKPIHAILFCLQRKIAEWQAAVAAHTAAEGSLAKTPKLVDFLGVKAFLNAYPEESVRVSSAATSGATTPAQPAVAGNGTSGRAEPTSATDAVAAPATAEPQSADTSAANG